MYNICSIRNCTIRAAMLALCGGMPLGLEGKIGHTGHLDLVHTQESD